MLLVFSSMYFLCTVSTLHLAFLSCWMRIQVNFHGLAFDKNMGPDCDIDFEEGKRRCIKNACMKSFPLLLAFYTDKES